MKGYSKITIVAIVESVVIVILALILFSFYSTIQSNSVQISSLKSDNADLKVRITKLENENVDLTEKVKGLIPYREAKGLRIQLTRQPNTHNPTWEELKWFLARDNTILIPYVDGEFTCGDFAATLFNNAEEAGIKAGLVIVQFEQGPPHAANAFFTKDKGLVFIDVTGSKSTHHECLNTRVAYISKGKKYGTLCPFGDYFMSFSYDYYENKTKDTNGTSVTYYPSSMVVGINHDKICYEEPLGIVKHFEIYW